MNNTEDVELREKLRQVLDLCPKENNCRLDEARLDNAILLFQQEANRQKAELLDWLSAQWGETIDHTLGKPIKIKFVALGVIEAERKKLEEKE